MRGGDASLYVWDHTSFVWRFEAMVAYWVQVFYLPLKLQVLLEILFMIGDENAPTQQRVSAVRIMTLVCNLQIIHIQSG